MNTRRTGRRTTTVLQHRETLKLTDERLKGLSQGPLPKGQYHQVVNTRRTGRRMATGYNSRRHRKNRRRTWSSSTTWGTNEVPRRKLRNRRGNRMPESRAKAIRTEETLETNSSEPRGYICKKKLRECGRKGPGFRIRTGIRTEDAVR